MRFTADQFRTRRTVLRAAVAVPLIGLGVNEARGFVDRHDGETLAGAVDSSFDGRKDLQIRRAGDPSGETPRRGRVLHATSDGIATKDYALTLAVTDEEELTLADLTSADEGFVYDWFEGTDETGHSPDEAWIVVRTADMAEGEVRALFRTEFFESRSGEWETRRVGPEIEGTVPEDGSGQLWKEYQFEELTSVRVTDDLVDEFGADATVLAAGIGRGTPQTEPTVADTYYDELIIDGVERSLEATEERGGGRG